MVFWSLLLSTCNLSEITENFIKVRIQGVYEEPALAPGSYEPISQTYELQEVYMIAADGSQESIYDDGIQEIRINKHKLLLTNTFVFVEKSCTIKRFHKISITFIVCQRFFSKTINFFPSRQKTLTEVRRQNNFTAIWIIN